MASRPFASINVALEIDEEPPDLIGGSIKVRGEAEGLVPGVKSHGSSGPWLGLAWGAAALEA